MCVYQAPPPGRPLLGTEAMWCLPHQPFSLWDLGSGVQMGIFAFKSKETERKLSKKLGHRPPPSPPQTPPGTKALAWHPLHPPGPTQKLKQLETWPDPRSVLVPAPATGVLPAGHDAHGKASWTVALGGKVSWGGGRIPIGGTDRMGWSSVWCWYPWLDPPGAPASTCSHRARWK